MLKYFENGAEKYSSPCVFLLGGFDGLHIGHKKLLDFARTFQLPVGIMTIEGGKGKALFTLNERYKIFDSQGVDFIETFSFSEKLKNTTGEKFLADLTDRFKIERFVCGKDFRFGKNAEGMPAFIREYTGIDTYDLDILNIDEKKVSATLIKEKLKEGKIKEANALLAHPFFVSGKVEEGRKTGRKLGFPTANMIYPQNKFLLKEGVYAVHSDLDGKRYYGICNVGTCPTFQVEYSRVETYFDGFEGDLYGRETDVFFDGYLRDICDFGSADRLKEQLKRDLNTVRTEYKSAGSDR